MIIQLPLLLLISINININIIISLLLYLGSGGIVVKKTCLLAKTLKILIQIPANVSRFLSVKWINVLFYMWMTTLHWVRN